MNLFLPLGLALALLVIAPLSRAQSSSIVEGEATGPSTAEAAGKGAAKVSPPNPLAASPDSLSLVPFGSYSFGSPNSPDPFGVDYSGPLDKRGVVQDEASSFNLRAAVALLNVQAILPESQEAFINNHLLHEHDTFQFVSAAGSCEITLASVDDRGIEFRWDKDTTTTLYAPPAETDVFAPTFPEHDLSQDQEPVIDLGSSGNHPGKGNSP